MNLDHSRMTQVLNNLILNASKFSPQGSMIMEFLNDGCKSMPLTRELELRPNKPKPYSIRSIESKPIQQKAFPALVLARTWQEQSSDCTAATPQLNQVIQPDRLSA
jgi:hypothetical protein